VLRRSCGERERVVHEVSKGLLCIRNYLYPDLKPFDRRGSDLVVLSVPVRHTRTLPPRIGQRARVVEPTLDVLHPR
jgi:hypothetical protein